MTVRLFSNKWICGAFAVVLALGLVACGENPIESAGNVKYDGFDNRKAVLEGMESELANVGMYSCYEKYGTKRCDAFNEKYGSYESEEISDTLNYDDGGNFIGSSSSEGEGISSSGTDSKKYLLQIKNVNLTLESFKQTGEVYAEGDTLIDPEVRFQVKTYCDGEFVNTHTTAFLLDSTDLREWSGSRVATVTIPRGIDEIRICPIVEDENELGNKTLSKDSCVIVSDIGFIEDRTPVSKESEGSDFSIGWSWYLFIPED